ncbi:Uncharacterised protein [Providencia stuartii]|nr:Uncharacterised protein [Providencia stuartii]
MGAIVWESIGSVTPFNPYLTQCTPPRGPKSYPVRKNSIFHCLHVILSFGNRIYNSRNHARGLFGQGWLTPFEVSVTREANHYCYRDMSGRELRFEPPVPGIQYFNADEGLIIAANERGDLTISDSDGECWRLFTPRDDNPAPPSPGVAER